MRTMKIALTQMDIAWENKAKNLEKAETLIQKAAAAGADMIIFPEMSFTGFSMDIEAIAEKVNEVQAGAAITDTVREIQKLSCKYPLVIVFGYVRLPEGSEKAQGMGINCLAAAEKGRVIMQYDKIHPFSYGGEEKHYISGTSITGCEIQGVPFGCFICYDLRFPEIFQISSQKNKVIIVIANWSWERIAHWKLLLQARAVENQCYILGVNRTGPGNGLYFEPSSMAFDPYGELISKETTGEILFATVDMEVVDRYRSQFPLKQDRRPELYGRYYSE